MMTPDRLRAFFDAWNAHDVETIVSWTFHGIGPEGQPKTYRGVDLFELEGDLISVKDAYRKERSRPVGG